MKYLGASYYPESWGLDRVAVDIKLMKDASINMVRLGEFAWSKMEKNEGEYDFDLFRKSIDKFAESNIDVMMCTPTAAPPAWLTHNYPETLVVDEKSHKAFHGIRQQCCYNNPLFCNLSNKITDELSKSLAACKNIPIWQIDNELGQRLFGFCHCNICQQDFRKYLKQRYKTLDHLNYCWKNEFWSQDYTDWDQVELAFLKQNHAVSRVLDSLRFYQETIKDYMMGQVEIIRKNIPGVKITTNNPVGVLDLYSIYEGLDYSAGDFYWDNRRTSNMALRLSTYRSFKKKPFYIAETGLYGDTYPMAIDKEARLDMWRSFAYGAISYLIFRWRPPLGGQEQTALGLVSPSGKPRRNHSIIKQMFTEAKSLEAELQNLTLPKAQAAIMVDSDVDKVYMRHGWGHSIKYNDVINNAFEQMHKRNIATDVISPKCDFDQYKLLILPSQRISNEGTAQRIKEFIHNGGTVWAIAECHTSDENGNFMLMDCPGYLTDEFGILLETGAVLTLKNEEDKIKLTGKIGNQNMESHLGPGWFADIDVKPGTDCLLTFANGYYKGQAAVTYNHCKAGHAIYQGISHFDPELYEQIAQFVIDKAGINYVKNCPENVEIIDCAEAVFFINHNENPVSFSYPLKGKALLGEYDSANMTISLKENDICIVKKH